MDGWKFVEWNNAKFTFSHTGCITGLPYLKGSAAMVQKMARYLSIRGPCQEAY